MPFDQMTANQDQPHVLFNELLAAVFAAGLFAKRASTTSGLTFGYYGGVLPIDGVLTTVNNGTVALTDSATNYIEATRAGTVSANTSAFTPGRYPLYTAACSGGVVGTLTDVRALVSPPWIGSVLAKTWPSDANYTLTAAEARASKIRLSGGSLGATRDLVVPLHWDGFVHNGTSGAQSIRVIGASGTGITIANGAGAFVYGDGTNINRASADV